MTGAFAYSELSQSCIRNISNIPTYQLDRNKFEGETAPAGPVYFDFYEVPALKAAETCFYKVGVSSEEARRVLDEQLDNLEDLARWIYAHVASVVTGDARRQPAPSHPGDRRSRGTRSGAVVAKA